jgi:hypothetical protein
MIRPAISQRLLFTMLVAIAAIAVACGSNASEATVFDASGAAGSPGADAAVSGEAAFDSVERQRGSAPQAQPASAPAPSFDTRNSGNTFLADIDEEASISGDGTTSGGLDSQIASAATERIIVRTVDIDIIVPNVAVATSQISDLAIRLGGWVVSSQQIESHTA